MNLERKGQSPFYPGQPVPVDLFVGRSEEIARIKRAAFQVAGGKPQSIFISGEYGIGKSSLARYTRVLLEEDPGFLGFHVMLGTYEPSLEGLGMALVNTITAAHERKPKVAETLRELLSDYVEEVSLFGVKLKLEKLKKDAPHISKGLVPFLRNIFEQLKSEYKGLMLILDEINGIVQRPVFARLLKSLVDENALSDHPLPLLLVLCGTEERYRELVENHKPVERIFDIARIGPLSHEEMKDFFEKSFAKAGMKIKEEAMRILCHFSGGLPKLMHILGDAAFWIAPQDVIDRETAKKAVLAAAEDVGRKFLDQQVYKAIHSEVYVNILNKLAVLDFDLAFNKADIETKLTEKEKKNFNNFLQRMKKLGVIASGDKRGEYIFRDRLTRLYMLMVASEKAGKVRG